ncbi:hypothetical protein GCM10017612_49240 [Novosphingobium resinovorum]|nr:hypothetical protein GCM10017612_49240 [Novosphingobium resinovorum]
MATGCAVGQVTVFSGAQRRRRWSLDEKLALVEASMAPGSSIVLIGGGIHQTGAIVGAVGKQMLEPGPSLANGRDDRLSASAVGDVGSGHDVTPGFSSKLD